MKRLSYILVILSSLGLPKNINAQNDTNRISVTAIQLDSTIVNGYIEDHDSLSFSIVNNPSSSTESKHISIPYTDCLQLVISSSQSRKLFIYPQTQNFKNFESERLKYVFDLQYKSSGYKELIISQIETDKYSLELWRKYQSRTQVFKSIEKIRVNKDNVLDVKYFSFLGGEVQFPSSEIHKIRLKRKRLGFQLAGLIGGSLLGVATMDQDAFIDLTPFVFGIGGFIAGGVIASSYDLPYTFSQDLTNEEIAWLFQKYRVIQ